MRYFVFTDIHGHCTELKNALNAKGFEENNPEHILISCGDNFDRGTENLEVFLYLDRFIKEDRLIQIRGNHEMFLERIIQRGYVTGMDYPATIKTLEEFKYKLGFGDYQSVILWMMENMRDYLDSFKWYYELGDFIFTHSWVPIDYKNSPGYVWREAVMIEGNYQYTQNEIVPNRIVVNGHRFSWKYHRRFKNPNLIIDSIDDIPSDYLLPYYDKGLIALDSYTLRSKRVNILVIDKIGKEYILNKELSD